MTDYSTSAVELTEILACEILDKIQKGEPAEYDHIRVTGDLDVNKLDLPTKHVDRTEYLKRFPGFSMPEKCKAVSVLIKITNSSFNGHANFGNIFFEDSINFENTTFSDANFYGAIFSGYTTFKGANFRSSAGFGDAQFGSYADFSDVSFQDTIPGSANFSGARFSGNAFFHVAKFSGEANFCEVTFSEDASFNATFGGWACFDLATFNGKASFEGAIFSRGATFKGVRFGKDAVFRGTHFKDATFEDSQFNQIADFNKSHFCGVANFIGSKFSEDVIFDNAIFKERLLLTRVKYEKLYIRWKDITVPKYKRKVLENLRKVKQLDYDDAAYLMLIENFKNLGLFEDADNIYYLYRTERRRNLPAPYKPIDWILMAFYGYGVKPLRPLGWLVVLLFAFGLLYYAAGTSPMEAFNTSLTLSLSGTQLIENPNHPATTMQYWIFTSEKLLASLFSAMFLVSVGRTIIR